MRWFAAAISLAAACSRASRTVRQATVCTESAPCSAAAPAPSYGTRGSRQCAPPHGMADEALFADLLTMLLHVHQHSSSTTRF
jgi:hypothetical protein